MVTTLELEKLQKLTRDIKAAAGRMSDDEARYLVDAYYQEQENRKRSASQQRELAKTKPEAPNEAIAWLNDVNDILERNICTLLDSYQKSHPLGRWADEIPGIGPVISAGLLAHIDITKAPTVGHIWRYAGLDPTVSWKKGEKRPWNPQLKTLCWKIGESFVKVSNLPNDIYGKVYQERKVEEWEHNLGGDLTIQAAVATERMRKLGKTESQAYQWYSGRVTAAEAQVHLEALRAEQVHSLILVEMGRGQAMLPPAHIQARAKRYAVKLFLAHFHEVAFFIEYGRLPPKPYILTQAPHSHWFMAPKVDGVPGLREAQESLRRGVIISQTE